VESKKERCHWGNTIIINKKMKKIKKLVKEVDEL